VTLTHLNDADRATFTAALAWIFEQSPWVAARAWARRPFASIDALHAAMMTEMSAATRDEQLALLRAHPDLGSRARMSDASIGEQAGAGLDRLSPGEFAELQRLNAVYRQRFEFPFLFAVRGATAADVLGALARRLKATPDEEFDEALRQVARIARFRLEDTVRI
jgi:2-oxo-4-hydroxy-4-carboxy-5-ureidoimidazoline decarboxylase